MSEPAEMKSPTTVLDALRLHATEHPWRWAIGFALAVVAIVLWRKPDALFNPQFWAEDGVIFFVQDAHFGAGAILTPYSHYLHLLPRLIAWLAGQIGPCAAPAVYVFGSLTIMGVTAARVFSPRVDLPAKPWLALTLALVPHHQGEVFANPTNLQWFTALLLPLVLVSQDPRTRGQLARDSLILLLTGLTGPFSMFAAPLFAWRWLRRRTRASFWLLLVIGLCALVQAALIFRALPVAAARTGPFAALEFLGIFGRRVPLMLVVGPLDGAFVTPPRVWLAGLTLMAAVLWATLASPRHREAHLMWWVFLVLVLASSTYKDRIDLYGFGNMEADRYFYIPKVLILWMLGTSVTLRQWHGRFALLLCATSLGVTAVFFRVPAFTDFHWEEYCERMEAGEQVRVPVNPPSWWITYPGRRADPPAGSP